MYTFLGHWLLLYWAFPFKCGKLGNWVFVCFSAVGIYSYGDVPMTSYGWRLVIVKNAPPRQETLVRVGVQQGAGGRLGGGYQIHFLTQTIN